MEGEVFKTKDFMELSRHGNFLVIRTDKCTEYTNILHIVRYKIYGSVFTVWTIHTHQEYRIYSDNMNEFLTFIHRLALFVAK